MRTKEMLNTAVKQARDDIPFQNYIAVRDWVCQIMDWDRADTGEVSEYWREELSGFNYMFDASPLIIEKLREHCYHLTGLHSYLYRGHHNRKNKPFAFKLEALRALDYSVLFVPESPLLGGFGHEIDGALVNLDTLKFYESLIAMDLSGHLAPLQNKSGERKVVIEIGAGWGGFAYQLKTVAPKVCYVIIDLPQTILFSATYLRSVFPEASFFMYGDTPTNLASYDFVFIPHFAFSELALPRIDMTINMVSFQEMTTAQVEGYARGLSEKGCPLIYSHNRDRSPHNKQLSTVSSILSKWYDLEEIKVLDTQYTQLTEPPSANQSSGGTGIVRALRSILKRGDGPSKRPVTDYRHLFGVRKN